MDSQADKVTVEQRGSVSEHIRRKRAECEECRFITRAELACYMDLVPERITQLVGLGTLPVDSQGRLVRAEALKAAFAWLYSRIGEGSSNIGAEKLAILQLERRLKQVQIDKEENKLIPADQVEKAWADIVLLVRQKLLKVANKVSPRLVFAKSEGEIEKEIQTEIEDCLRDLSRTPDIAQT